MGHPFRSTCLCWKKSPERSSLRIGVLTTSYPTHEEDFAGSFVAGMVETLIKRGHSVTLLAPRVRSCATTSGPPSSCGIPSPSCTPGSARSDSCRVSGPGGGLEKSGLFAHRVRYPWPERWPSVFNGGGAPDSLEANPWLWAELPPFLLCMARDALRLLRGVDVIISHWLIPCGILASILFPKKKHLAVAHSSDVRMLAGSVFAEAGVRLLLGSNVEVMFSCEAVRNVLMERLSQKNTVALKQRSFVQPMGAEPQRVVGGHRARIREELGIEGFCVLFLGRLVPIKRPEWLLALARGVEEATFIVAGDGPLRESLQRRVEASGFEARFRFEGAVGPDRKRDLLSGADVMVSTSGVTAGGRTEGAPVSMMEGAIAGLPVVATEVGGVGEIVVDGETGFLCSTDQPDSMISALKRLKNDPDLLRSLSQETVERSERFGWKAVMDRIEDVIRIGAE